MGGTQAWCCLEWGSSTGLKPATALLIEAVKQQQGQIREQGRRLPYKRTKNSRADSWKRSHKILIVVPSPPVHIVDGGHFSLDMVANATAAQMSNFSNTWLNMAS